MSHDTKFPGASFSAMGSSCDGMKFHIKKNKVHNSTSGSLIVIIYLLFLEEGVQQRKTSLWKHVETRALKTKNAQLSVSGSEDVQWEHTSCTKAAALKPTWREMQTEPNEWHHWHPAFSYSLCFCSEPLECMLHHTVTVCWSYCSPGLCLRGKRLLLQTEDTKITVYLQDSIFLSFWTNKTQLNVKTRWNWGWHGTPEGFSNLTLVSALIRQHQAGVFTLRLHVRESFFNFTEAEIFFEECVTVQDGVGETQLHLRPDYTVKHTLLWFKEYERTLR